MAEEPLTQVICRQSDCMYYRIFTEHAGKVFCSHPEKEFYMDRNPCPLYRMDWAKKAGGEMDQANAQQFLKVLKKPVR